LLSQDKKSSSLLVDKITSKSENTPTKINHGNSASLTSKNGGVPSLGLENYDSEEEG